MGETCLYEFHPSGWLRASALTCRSIPLDGVKWSCLRINENPLSHNQRSNQDSGLFEIPGFSSNHFEIPGFSSNQDSGLCVESRFRAFRDEKKMDPGNPCYVEPRKIDIRDCLPTGLSGVSLGHVRRSKNLKDLKDRNQPTYVQRGTLL